MTDENRGGIGKSVRINAERLYAELLELGKIGYTEGQGVTRPALSDADMAAKAWLVERLTAAGLETHTDAAFNVIGTLKSTAPRDKRVVVVGSHLDTVPQGGVFDGPVGVLAGLECARTLKEHRIVLPWDLEIINFCDEEAGHNAGTVGSRAMLGHLQEGEIHRAKAKGLSTFAAEMLRHGQDPDRIGEAAREASLFKTVLELHIEQGNLLESKAIQVGIVTGIAGIYRYVVTVTGEAGHAGTTPMYLRNDALVKAAPVFTLLPQWVRARNRDMVATIGQLMLEPGATNVIPGKCEFVVELRSMQRDDMTVIRDLLREWAEAQPGCTVQTIYEKDSVALSEAVIATIARAAEAEGVSNLRMASGAGHDAQSFASYVPTGMIFIPCRNGKSHSPEEWAERRQVADGCQVLLRTLLEMAAEE